MKINNHSGFKPFARADIQKKDNKVCSKGKKAARHDKVEISSRMPVHLRKTQDIRPDKVEEARKHVRNGKYDNPEVVDKIVSRLIKKLGY